MCVASCVLGVRLDAQILEYVSRFMTLFPGYVILTGRPPPLDGFPPHGVPVEASAVPPVALLLRYSASLSFVMWSTVGACPLVTGVRLGVQVGDKVTCRISEIGTFSCTLSEADSQG